MANDTISGVPSIANVKCWKLLPPIAGTNDRVETLQDNNEEVWLHCRNHRRPLCVLLSRAQELARSVDKRRAGGSANTLRTRPGVKTTRTHPSTFLAHAKFAKARRCRLLRLPTLRPRKVASPPRHIQAGAHRRFYRMALAF